MKELSLAQVLENFFTTKTSTLYTAIPCRIVTVKSSLNDQRVDVQPLPNKVLPDGASLEQPSILNVPVIFPASKKASLTFPLDVGDTVLCVFSQRSLDIFKGSSNTSTYSPQDRRMFSPRDAVAIPGLFPFDLAVNEPSKHKWTHSTRDLVIVNNVGDNTECEVRLKENGDIELKTDQDFYGTFNDGLIECANLTINCTGNFTVDADGDVSISSGGNSTFTSGVNTTFNVTGILALNAATWNATISGTTTVNTPTTNWTGAFNITGPLAVAGGLSMTGGGASAVINAPLEVNDDITITGGDVVADGISLKTHTHNENGTGGGVTDAPN